MRPEDVPQRWRTLMIGAMQEAFDDNMMARHYADIERMVDEGLAAVAPLIRRAALDEAAGVLSEAARRIRGGKKRVNMVDEHTASVLDDKAAAIRALDA